MTPSPPSLKYLNGYPPQLLAEVGELLAQRRLGALIAKRYPEAHDVRTDGALYGYVTDLKTRHMRNAPPLSRIAYDSTLHVVRNALGTHTAVSRVQGGKLKSKNEIRIAAVFRDTPEALLRMIVVHELAHLRIREHDKDFYKLCCHMEPAYHQLEFDARVWLFWRETDKLAGTPSPA